MKNKYGPVIPKLRILHLTIALLFLLQSGKAQNVPPTDRMDYHLSWDGISSILKINLLYNARDNESLTFVFGNPEAGGQPHIFKILKNVTVNKEDSLSLDAAIRQIKIYHHGNGIKKLHFEIDCKLIRDKARALPNEAFLPTLEKGFLYTLGYQLFLDFPDQRFKQIGIVWDSWPKDMPYFVSTDPKAAPNNLQIIAANKDEMNVFMLQMSNDLIINKYVVKGIDNYLLTSKNDTTSGLPKDIIPLMEKFIPDVRDFWQDYTGSYYILSAIQLRNDVGSQMTGMGLRNGFSVRYRGPLDLHKTQVISHEISHTWIGTRLKYGSIEMENNWFNEGFNDYIAVYNLARTGLFDDKAFVNYVNDNNLKAHYTSPVATIPGDSISTQFFTNILYQKLPYQRGFIYAFYLDNQIRLATKGKQNIRDFLIALYAENRKMNNNPIEKSTFVKIIAPFLPYKDIAKEIDTYLLGGKLVDFKKVKLIKAFKMNYEKGWPELSLTEGTKLQEIYN
jgi:predicted metalloprotease with PDZ domain